LVRVIGDPALATRLGQSGRALVEMEYDWEAIGRHLVSVYRRLLERPAA
jgi:glycosyltransferase involved in cell wall biosynthesis